MTDQKDIVGKAGIIGNLDHAQSIVEDVTNRLCRLWSQGNIMLTDTEIKRLREVMQKLDSNLLPFYHTLEDFEEITKLREKRNNRTE